MGPYRFTAGAAPLLVSMPHVGTGVPPEIESRLSETARSLPDTDWHVERLYDFLSELGASVIAATQSRYVIDLNRPPDDAPLYPGAQGTGLCPTTTFAGEPLYRPGTEPDAAEIAARREAVWRPYHARLAEELAALRQRHGIALLWEAHSIRSRVPRLFEGRLPDLNFGTAADASAAPELLERLEAVAATAPDYAFVANGRFTGGYITRAYGAPASGVHAVQLELSQITYMEEDPPYRFREERAARIRPLLRRLLEAALAWARAQTGER